MSEDRAYQALEIIDRIKPLLAGHPPEVQGAVLADLLALWLAAHNSDARAGVLDAHLNGVIQLVELNEQTLFGGRHPFDRADH